jgi:hypothetical protein
MVHIRNDRNSFQCVKLLLSNFFSFNSVTNNDSSTTQIIFTNSSNDTLKNIDLGYDDTYQILLPFISGLFVALCLAWMLIRYKATKYQRNQTSESIYCCPENCFRRITNLRRNR